MAWSEKKIKSDFVVIEAVIVFKAQFPVKTTSSIDSSTAAKLQNCNTC